MSFRRIPFQFSTTDPVERQLELEKRFGLPTSKEMYVDAANPLSMVTGNRDFSSSSPRLQHRVPIFVEGHDQPVKASVDSINPFPEKKPNVRVIPIEVEGAGTQPSTRHRTLSGPAGIAKKDEYLSSSEVGSPLKRSMHDLSQPLKVKPTTGLRVHNIPIKIEGRDFKTPGTAEQVIKSSKKGQLKTNGCAISKSTNKVKSPEKEKIEQKEIKPDYNTPLKKIESILEELKSYESGVQEFNGTVKDKQYKYLDEMLTRCMLRLDDIDTMGNENIRSARKNAVKKVQACIDLLETKVNPQGDPEVNEPEQEIKSEVDKDVAMKKVINEEPEEKEFDNQSQSTVSDTQEQSGMVVKDNALKTEEVLLEAESSQVKIGVNEVEMTNNNEVISGVPEIPMSESVCSSQNDNMEYNEVEMKEQNKDSEVPPHVTSQISTVAEEKQDMSVPSSEVKINDVEMKEISEKETNIHEDLCTKATSILDDHYQSEVQDNAGNRISIANEIEKESEKATEHLQPELINLESKSTNMSDHDQIVMSDSENNQHSVANEIEFETASQDLKSEPMNVETKTVSATSDLSQNKSMCS